MRIKVGCLTPQRLGILMDSNFFAQIFKLYIVYMCRYGIIVATGLLYMPGGTS